MADNRMFLVHLPTGLAAPIAKRTGYGWHVGEKTQQSMGELVALLFKVLEEDYNAYEGEQDEFAIALEDASNATLATGEWQYGEKRTDGLVQLEMTHQ